MTFRIRTLGLLCLIVFGGAPTIALASPTMVRLGYAGCRACHLAPQGAGLLTDYGKGIDVAQSLRSGEYDPSDPSDPTQPRPLRYDLRLLTSGYMTTPSPSGTRPSPPSWLRSYFRSSAAFGSHRLSSSVVVEAPAGEVSRLWESRPVVDIAAAWEYRPADRFALAVAHDRLPRGVELGETRTILQDGDGDRFPSQLRAYVTTNRFNVTAYAYGPGSSNALDRRSRGAGVLGEMQFFSNHLVLGVSARRALEDTVVAEPQETRPTLTRQIVGGYTRMGYGKWGLLAEHEFTRRTISANPQAAPDRYAGYTQLFFAPKEWLVLSAIGEQSRDTATTTARTFRWRPEVQARLSSNITITASARTDSPRGAMGPSRIYLVQLAMKTVQ
jgi:hypothetical protein